VAAIGSTSYGSSSLPPGCRPITGGSISALRNLHTYEVYISRAEVLIRCFNGIEVLAVDWFTIVEMGNMRTLLVSQCHGGFSFR